MEFEIYDALAFDMGKLPTLWEYSRRRDKFQTSKKENTHLHNGRRRGHKVSQLIRNCWRGRLHSLLLSFQLHRHHCWQTG